MWQMCHFQYWDVGTICGWVGTAGRKAPPGTLGWEWVWWFFRNPLRRTASEFGIWHAKIGSRRSTPFGLEQTRSCGALKNYISIPRVCWSAFSSRHIEPHSLRVKCVIILTQFRASVYQVGRVYFHVADI